VTGVTLCDGGKQLFLLEALTRFTGDTFPTCRANLLTVSPLTLGLAHAVKGG